MTHRRKLPLLVTRLSMMGLMIASNSPVAQSLGSAFTYQGQLKELGQPASGLYDLQVCLFDGPSDPIPLACAPDFNDVPVEGGLFAITLNFGSAPFIGQQRYLELRVRPGASGSGYTILAPRQLVRPAPEALRANVAGAAPWSGLTGVPAGFADGVDNDTGTVTSIATGAGLTGGPITGSGSIAVAPGGIGAALIDPAQVQSRVAGNCVVGQYVRAVNQDGTVDCGVDANSGGSVTSIATGAGLTGGPVTGSGTIAVAPGGIGAVQINPTQVQARVVGACAVGQYLRAVNADGSVLCGQPASPPGITVVDAPIPPDGNDFGKDNSIAIAADGMPVVSYIAGSGQALRVAKCANHDCSGPATTITALDDIANVARSGTSIAAAPDGLPVISYMDQTARALKVAKCANALCSGMATISVIDDPPMGNSATETSIAIGGDGLPVIGYSIGSGGRLRVAKCTNVSCTSATVSVVDGASSPADFISIAVGVDGLPIISYHSVDDPVLKVAKCANAACTGSAAVTTVDDSANNVGSYTSIAVPSDGLPVISYRDETVGRLKVAKCANPSCSGVATITTVYLQPGTLVAKGTAVAIGVDGLPVISYDGRFVKCENAACTASNTSRRFFYSGHLVQDFSMAIGSDGLPVISVLSPPNLVVAKCGTANCQ